MVLDRCADGVCYDGSPATRRCWPATGATSSRRSVSSGRPSSSARSRAGKLRHRHGEPRHEGLAARSLARGSDPQARRGRGRSGPREAGDTTAAAHPDPALYGQPASRSSVERPAADDDLVGDGPGFGAARRSSPPSAEPEPAGRGARRSGAAAAPGGAIPGADSNPHEHKAQRLLRPSCLTDSTTRAGGAESRPRAPRRGGSGRGSRRPRGPPARRRLRREPAPGPGAAPPPGSALHRVLDLDVPRLLESAHREER